MAVWKAIINLLCCPRRERNFRGAGVAKTVTDCVRDFVPFDDVKFLHVNFDLTDLAFDTHSRTMLAASCDGLFKFNSDMGCWTLLYKFTGVNTQPVYLDVNQNGDIY